MDGQWFEGLPSDSSSDRLLAQTKPDTWKYKLDEHAVFEMCDNAFVSQQMSALFLCLRLRGECSRAVPQSGAVFGDDAGGVLRNV